MKRMGIIYEYHLDRPLNEAHPKRPKHYIGFCEFGNLAERDRVHQRGERWAHDRNGEMIFTGAARFLQVAGERRIGFQLVRAWRGTRDDERRLKRQHAGPSLCPACAAACGRAPRQVGFLDEISLEAALAEKRRRARR